MRCHNLHPFLPCSETMAAAVRPNTRTDPMPNGAKPPPSDGTVPVPADGGSSPSFLDEASADIASTYSYFRGNKPPVPIGNSSSGGTPQNAPPPPSVFWTTNTIITTSVLFGVIGILAYWFFGRKTEVAFGIRAGNFVMYSTIVLLLGFGIYFIYWGVTGDKTQSGNLASTPVTTSSSVVVPATKAPAQAGPGGGNYGVQWWMFINDWDYKFGEKKPVIRRGDKRSYNPDVFLHPTENTLSVRISTYPSDGTTTGSEPAPARSDGSATDDTFTCSVPNVPLQKWFAVAVSVSGRNVDIYLDGLLVRSCLLPGVPRAAKGNIELMPDGGFSGSVIDLYHYSRSLVPADAQQFAAKGTNGTAYNALPSKSLFGYTVKLGVVDDSGKEIKNYVL